MMVDLSKINRIDEARYSKRQEMDFVIRNRRNRLIGLWAGQKLGMDEKDTAGYATDIVGEAIVTPGDAGLVATLMRDRRGERGGYGAELAAELERFHRVATMEFGETGEKSPQQPHAA